MFSKAVFEPRIEAPWTNPDGLGEPVSFSEPPLPLRQTERVVQIKSRPTAASSSVAAGKKSRFFLSKTTNDTKRAAYRHKWVADGEVDEEAKAAAAKAAAGVAEAKSNAYDDFDSDFGSTSAAGEAPKLRRVVTATSSDGADLDEDGRDIVSYKCSREEKKVCDLFLT